MLVYGYFLWFVRGENCIWIVVTLSLVFSLCWLVQSWLFNFPWHFHLLQFPVLLSQHLLFFHQLSHPLRNALTLLRQLCNLPHFFWVHLIAQPLLPVLVYWVERVCWYHSWRGACHRVLAVAALSRAGYLLLALAAVAEWWPAYGKLRFTRV